jgi:cell wall-associated NlpC family hydrolase
VAFAKSRVGTPYCWGGNGPGCYDCSGLTTASWKAGGKAIPRTSEAQADLPEVPFDEVQPGDIFWRPGHVALYVGDGRVVQAPHTGDVVKYSPATNFVKAVRP